MALRKESFVENFSKQGKYQLNLPNKIWVIKTTGSRYFYPFIVFIAWLSALRQMAHQIRINQSKDLVNYKE